MALKYIGTEVAIDENRLPPDYSKPRVETFMTDYKVDNVVLIMKKAIVDDPDSASMFENIVSLVGEGVKRRLKMDFNVELLNFTAYATILKVESDVERHGLRSSIEDFYVTVRINIKKD